MSRATVRGARSSEPDRPVSPAPVKVSVITVCRNGVDCIDAAVASVLSQDYPDLEYVVVDGASDDGTLERLERWGERISVLVSEPDEGLYDAMNKGIALASGDVVAFLHADDVYHSRTAVSRMMAPFLASDALDVAIADVVYVTAEQRDRVRRLYSSRRFRPWKMRFGWMPPHLATFVRRRAYERHGLYRTDYRISADYELLVRLLWRARVPWTRVDEIVVRMTYGGLSTAGWRSSVTLNREIVRACRGNGLFTALPLVLSKIPLKLLELVSPVPAGGRTLGAAPAPEEGLPPAGGGLR